MGIGWPWPRRPRLMALDQAASQRTWQLKLWRLRQKDMAEKDGDLNGNTMQHYLYLYNYARGHGIKDLNDESSDIPVLLGSRGQLSNQYILAQSAAGLKEKISMHRHRGLQKLQAWPHVHSGRAERSISQISTCVVSFLGKSGMSPLVADCPLMWQALTNTHWVSNSSEYLCSVFYRVSDIFRI